jgi:anti-sigma factor RsiW
MACVELLRTQAFVDGELDGAASRDAERHLQDCAECQDFVAAAASTGDLVRRGAVRHSAPAHLRRKVLQDVRAQASPRRAGGFWLGAGSGAGVMAMAAGFALFLLLPPSAATLSQALVDDHTGALMAGRQIAVVSTSHHTVKPWFAGKVAVSPPVADFAAQGFALAGGRTARVAGSDAAVVVYRHGAHDVDLYVWADRGGALPESGLRHGYRLMAWKEGDLDFAVVSDMENAEFENFARLVRDEKE